MKNVTIQIATNADASGLAKVLQELFAIEVEFDGDFKTQEDAIKYIIDNQIGDIFKISLNDEIIGMCSLLYSYSTALNTKIAILEDVVISKAHRNTSYGNQLIKFVLNYAENKGIKRVSLLTDSTNINAQHFYKKYGFEHSKMILMRNHFRG